MPETTTGLRSALSSPRVYDLAMFIMGSKRSRRQFVNRYLRVKGGEDVLDIGCGTAEILDYMPPVRYTGWDTSAEYIESCQQRYPDQTFKQGALPDGTGTYDIVMALGVLHHMNDDECRAFFAAAKRNLKPGGRVVTLDACKTPMQNPAARVFFALDRGQAIRFEKDYLELAHSELDTVKSHVVTDLMPVWIPYTHIIMEGTASVPSTTPASAGAATS
jgi:cyclopropane fatty-acyl-phospholipid synthase-like methyltransferase